MAFNYISKNVVDMHAAPNAKAEVVSQAIYATPITLIKSQGPWTYIQTPDEYRGWIKGSSQLFRETPYPSTTNIAEMDALWAHIFCTNDTTPHPPTITLPFGTRIEITSDSPSHDPRWMRVRLLDNQILWAQKSDFRINPTPLALEEMVRLSHRFLGIPYLWGGVSSFGFDCSGFVQTMYRQIGLSLPRDSMYQAQSANALPVKIDELLPADLVFFGKCPPQITHVGMFLGNGNFIHSVTTNATGHHAIRVSPLSDPEWHRLYITARRYTRL